MKKIFCFALILSMIFSISSGIYATTIVHEASYDWYLNNTTKADGTVVNQTIPTVATWSYGDVSTTTKVINVTEKVEELAANSGIFSWTMTNIALTGKKITSFHVFSEGIVATAWTVPNTNWVFSQSEKVNGELVYSWKTQKPNGIDINTLLSGMSVTVPTIQWIINDAVADFNRGYGGAIAYGDGAGQVENWQVSGPTVPEPGTMLLIGSLATGLFGFAGAKKRFKA